MAGAHSAESWLVTVKAGGTISKGHGVVYSAAETVVQCTGANTAQGVYVGEDDAASGDFITVCIGGPCKVFADGSSAITWGAVMANDTSGHFVVDTTDKHKLAGMFIENLASGTGMIEAVFVPTAFNAV